MTQSLNSFAAPATDISYLLTMLQGPCAALAQAALDRLTLRTGVALTENDGKNDMLYILGDELGHDYRLDAEQALLDGPAAQINFLLDHDWDLDDIAELMMLEGFKPSLCRTSVDPFAIGALQISLQMPMAPIGTNSSPAAQARQPQTA